MLPPMRKAITLTLSVALLGIFAAVVVAAVDSPNGASTLPASSTGTTETTETDRTATSTTPNGGVDISGPCDEAEHANDPRCAGAQAPPAGPAPPQGGGMDISGPCDEAEHANDPRCTGAGTGAGRFDNSGPGSVNSGRDDDFDDDDGFDDHSGSGHGGDDFDDHGGDDFDDDSSGSGHGGGGNSGHGGGDD